MASLVTHSLDVPPQDILNDDPSSYTTGELVYLSLFGVAVLFQLINIVGLLLDVVSEVLYQCKHGQVWHVKDSSEMGTVSIVLPCYMPNEHVIVEDTIRHLLEELAFEEPGEPESRVTLYCVYNAPKAWSHPVETKLAAMDGKTHGPHGRLFRSIRVEDSTSKAANLNHVIPHLDTDYTVIYDADHHPDKQSLRIALSRLKNKNLDCVQGSTYIRSGHSLMGCLIDAEFFFNYFVIFRALAGVTRTGFFGGSNAFWRTEVLQRQLFDHSVQTEDIEYSLRALLSDVKIGFCPEARSGELPPASFAALWRQRKRWALGWDQVTLLHTPKIWSSSLSACRKVSLFWTFILRWVSIVAMLILACIHPVMIGVTIAHDLLEVEEPLDFSMFNHGVGATLMNVSTLAFLVLAFTTFLTILFVERDGRLCRQLSFVTLFFVFACVPIILMAVLQLVSFRDIYKGNTSGWVVTTRAQPKPVVHVTLVEGEAVPVGKELEPTGGKTALVFELDPPSATSSQTTAHTKGLTVSEPDPESPMRDAAPEVTMAV